jgi:hypothetical protein
LVDLVPYVAEVTIAEEEPGSGDLKFGDSLVSGTNAELLLVAKVNYYYKEKSKNYTPAQRGSKGSEEKIKSFDLYLESDGKRIPLGDRVSKLTLKTANDLQHLPQGIAVNVTNRNDRSFESLEDFIARFNAGETPFIYDYNLAPAYSFSLNTNGIPFGQYNLTLDIRFDSGNELRHAVPLTIKSSF